MTNAITAEPKHTLAGERNDDSSPVNDKRNGPMTNAERQRRYRDKRRGGPPAGRWADLTSAAKHGEVYKISRTMIFMCSWVCKHAPEYEEQFAAGKTKVSPVYRRLKREYDVALFKALDERPSDDAHLVCRRENGEFVFEWIKE